MKLSEQLKQDHECGDFGKALVGYAGRAAELERDAARYRWLRDSSHNSEALHALLDGVPSVIGGHDEFDEAIDAAMLKTPNV